MLWIGVVRRLFGWYCGSNKCTNNRSSSGLDCEPEIDNKSLAVVYTDTLSLLHCSCNRLSLLCILVRRSVKYICQLCLSSALGCQYPDFDTNLISFSTHLAFLLTDWLIEWLIVTSACTGPPMWCLHCWHDSPTYSLPLMYFHLAPNWVRLCDPSSQKAGHVHKLAGRIQHDIVPLPISAPF